MPRAQKSPPVTAPNSVSGNRLDFSHGSVGGVAVHGAEFTVETQPARKPRAAVERRTSTPANTPLLSPLFTQLHEPFDLL